MRHCVHPCNQQTYFQLFEFTEASIADAASCGMIIAHGRLICSRLAAGTGFLQRAERVSRTRALLTRSIRSLSNNSHSQLPLFSSCRLTFTIALVPLHSIRPFLAVQPTAALPTQPGCLRIFVVSPRGASSLPAEVSALSRLRQGVCAFAVCSADEGRAGLLPAGTATLDG